MKKYLFILVILIINNSYAQVGIGTTMPDASSILDLTSTTAGFLPPRMTTSQRNAIVLPANGLMIYNTSLGCLEWWNGALWQNACGTTFQTTIPSNPLCIGKTISKTPCSQVLGATLNDNLTTLLGIEYDWVNASNNSIGIGIGATTNTRALVEIGGQCWCRYNMDIENTNLTAFTNTNTSASSGYYNGVASEPAANEGRLYQWSAAMKGSLQERNQGICPAGFHIPSDCEWMYLEQTLGMSLTDLQGTNFRNSGDVGSDISTLTLAGTNSSGFTGLFAGLRSAASTYSGRPTSAYWWTSSESNSLDAIYRAIDNANSGINRLTNTTKSNGFCVRCLKD